MLYTCPRLYNAEDCLQQVNQRKVQLCEAMCRQKGDIPCSDETVFELCCIIMHENNYIPPTNAEEAKHLYTSLRQNIYANL